MLVYRFTRIVMITLSERGAGGAVSSVRAGVGPRTRGLNVDKFYWLDSLLLVVLRISGRSSTNQNKAKS